MSETFKFIYSDSLLLYWSQKFVDLYIVRGGDKSKLDCNYRYSLSEDKDLYQSSFARNPIAIQIIEELGSEKCCLCTDSVRIIELPKLFDGFVVIESRWEGYGDDSEYHCEIKIRYDDLLLSLMEQYISAQEEGGLQAELLDLAWLAQQCKFIKEFKIQKT